MAKWIFSSHAFIFIKNCVCAFACIYVRIACMCDQTCPQSPEEGNKNPGTEATEGIELPRG